MEFSYIRHLHVALGSLQVLSGRWSSQEDLKRKLRGAPPPSLVKRWLLVSVGFGQKVSVFGLHQAAAQVSGEAQARALWWGNHPRGSCDLVLGKKEVDSTVHADTCLLRGPCLNMNTLRVEGKRQNCAVRSEQKNGRICATCCLSIELGETLNINLCKNSFWGNIV